MDPAQPCELLEWDSAHFGVRIARVAAAPLDAALIGRADAWCRAQRIECLYVLVPGREPAAPRVLEADGFNLVDLRVTLECAPLRPAGVALQPGVEIGPANGRDVEALKAMARVSHTDSRFYADGRFDRERCGRLYETWIEKACAGAADVVWVARDGGTARGYISCRMLPGGTGQIDLLAVDAAARERGLGRALVGRALDWFSERGGGRATVVTQGRNIASQRLYQRCGFVVQSVDLWYHKWFRPAS